MLLALMLSTAVREFPQFVQKAASWSFSLKQRPHFIIDLLDLIISLIARPLPDIKNRFINRIVEKHLNRKGAVV